MPTLSEMNEHANDAEHQAFQRAYDELLNVAKDPITCRHFWDAGRSSLRRELEGQEAVSHEYQSRNGKWQPFMDQRHRENTERDGTWPIRALYARPIPPPDMRELVEAADAVVKRWDSPLWKDAPHTGDYIARLRAALAKFGGGV